MAKVDLPLSKGNVKGLIRSLKQLSAELKDDIPVDIERSIGAFVAEDVRSGIASIRDVDGNYLGSDNPNASVTVQADPIGGHKVVWLGQQIAYLEFGTGATGAAGNYPGVAMPQAGYHPDPTKESWRYEDKQRGWRTSHGLSPQAPMYNASMAMRMSGKTLVPARKRVKEALDAVTI